MQITDFLGLLGGLALFLYGMQMMSEGLEDAAGNRTKSILEKLTSNRFLGVIVGALITAVIASIGTNRAAKRTTIIHLMFNMIGTCIFTIVCLAFPLEEVIAGLTPNNVPAQIANMHTTFNIATTLLLLPFGNYMAKLAVRILPDEEGKERVSVLDSMEGEFTRALTKFGSSAVHMDLLEQEIRNMVMIAGENVKDCYSAILNSDMELLQKIKKNEKTLDILNKEISQCISKILVHNNSDQNVAAIEEYFLITGNAERIGDHAYNIGGYLDMIQEKSIVFSDMAREEIKEMQIITEKTMDKVLNKEIDIEEWLCKIAALEQQIDDMTKKYREKHLKRMRDGLWSDEACILFSELLTDFERIGNHLLNIGQAYSKIYKMA